MSILSPQPLDSLHLLDSIREFPDQCRQVVNEMAQQIVPPACSLVDNIVISGMGGSAFGGRIAENLERQIMRVPIVVSTEFHLPSFVGPKTLVVISSYSGDTAETIASLQEARARNAQIFVITSGGKLAKMAKEMDLPHYIFNPIHNLSAQPRMGVGYNALAVLILLSRCQLIHPLHELGGLADFLASRQELFPKLKDLSTKLTQKIPLIIASEHLKGPAYCFKNQINENAKTISFLYDLPELNHHLLEGLTFPSSNPRNLIGIFLTSQKYHPELIRRYPITQQVFKKNHISFIELEASGPNRLYETFDVLQSGGFIAFSLALLHGVDPGPIPWVDWYKNEVR